MFHMKFRPKRTKCRPNNHHYFGLVKLMKKIAMGIQKLPNWQTIAQSGHPDALSLSIPCL
jgi:hypothetical protein